MKPPIKRVIQFTAVALFVAIVLLVLFPGYVAAVVGPPLDKARAHRMLTGAKTPGELRVAVGSLGAFFPLRDGSWLAVRYTDSHAFPGYSCAVAVDSASHWFYSNHHFCGRFRIYFQMEKKLRALAAANGDSEENVQKDMLKLDAQIFELTTATNLDAAREQLLVMGFTQE